ncbi:MAG: hypothetical protein K8T89_12925 [Planctomycetes bacterium]|nr:hypothetical protein [Planctomycetota bacterium]
MPKRHPFYQARLNVERLEERETPSAAPWAIESFDQLVAPSLPAAWTQWSSAGNTFSTSTAKAASGPNTLVTNAASTVTSRFWRNDAVGADFGVQANVFTDSLIPVQVFARGRDLATATPDYYAVSITRGLQVDLVRVVDGVSTTLASLKSNSYVSGKWVQVSLTLQGDQLAVQVFRADTAQYLNASGNWQALEGNSLQAKDAMIAGGGQVGINRPARYAGAISIDDIAILPPGRAPVSETFNSLSNGSIPNGWSRWSTDNALGFGATSTKAVDGLGLASNGTSSRGSRAWIDESFSADVQALSSIYVDSLIPAQVMIRGTNLASSTPTYYALTATRGVTVELVRVVDGVSTTLARLQSANYTSNLWLRVSLTAEGNHLQARVQRSDTGQWLNRSGGWQANTVAAFDVLDGTITGDGHVGLARPASYAGNVWFDNFEAKPGTADIKAPTMQVIFPNPNQGVSGPINIPVTVADSSGIAQVEYLVDGLLTSVDTSGPFDWKLDTRNFNNGVRTLLIRAFDREGNHAEISRPVTFTNAAPYTLPDIAKHYSHIRIAQLAYSGNPMGAIEKQLLQTSVDLVVPNPKYLATINQTSSSTPQLIYSNVSNLYQELLTDWLAYADSKGISREEAFYHVARATPFDGTSASAQPVNWFWNAELGPITGTSGFKKLTGEARDTNIADTSFGGTGQAIYLGYTDKFREINLNLSRGKQGGWNSVIEYASAIDANGNPTAWKTLSLQSDTTNGLGQSGRVTFDPPADWKTAIVPGSTAKLFYVRIRTTAGIAAEAPIATSILGRDYVNANGNYKGVIPTFDVAADRDGDGYLNDTEYAQRATGKDARFVYESRLIYPYYGQMRFVTNPTNPHTQEWSADYHLRVLAANPLADGFFLDNSSGKNPIKEFNLVESAATYTADYSAMLATINRAIAPRWIIANTSNGGVETDQVVRQVPATMEEFAIRAMAHNWQQFTDLADTVARRQAVVDPSGYMILDSLSTGGAPTSFRTQMATLAYYYLIGDPNSTFLMLWGGEEPASTWSRHWFNAIATNVGQPIDEFSIFATGRDPANTARTYNIYQRNYDNALVLYKPLSYAQGQGNGTTADSSYTTHVLGGSYRPLNSDGTLGTPVTTVSLRNGEGVVLIRS